MFRLIYLLLLGVVVSAGSLQTVAAQADSIFLEGYVFAADHTGYIAEAKVQVKRQGQAGVYLDSLYTGLYGTFKVAFEASEVMPTYEILVEKAGFESQRLVYTPSVDSAEFTAQFPMKRLPGYMLEASLLSMADGTGHDVFKDMSVEGATIEVYNNTLKREALRLVDFPRHRFNFHLEQGNEYIFMIRREGFYTKRLRANVNVNGCILCFEGIGEVRPQIVENMTQGNMMGTLSANIELEPIVVGATKDIPNIYYDFGSARLRPEAEDALDQLVLLMKDNPQLIVELGSHTDSRGSNSANLKLSQARAQSVVNYVIRRGKINGKRITAKGYGETKLVNSCADGVDCSEEMHQKNRRTELLIVDTYIDESEGKRPLSSIMQDQNFTEILAANQQSYFEAKEERFDERGAGVKKTTRPTSKNKVGGRRPMGSRTSTRPTQQAQAAASSEAATSARQTKKQPTAPRVVPPGYTGYKIEAMTLEGMPAIDLPIFFEFDAIFMMPTETPNVFAYLVGDYATEAAAKEALSTIRKNYPKAKIVSYKDGKRAE